MIRPLPQIFILERKLRENINHAKLICKNHEDTVECKLAWDRVEDVQKGLRKTREKEKALEKERALKEWCEDDPIACRDYES